MVSHNISSIASFFTFLVNTVDCCQNKFGEITTSWFQRKVKRNRKKSKMIHTNEIARQIFIMLIFTITKCAAGVLPSIRPRGIRDIVWHELENNEESSIGNQYDEYGPFETVNSVKWDYDCEDYVINEAQKKELREYEAESEQKFENIFPAQDLLIAGLALLVIVIYGVYCCCSSKTKASQKNTTTVRSGQQEATTQRSHRRRKRSRKINSKN